MKKDELNKKTGTNDIIRLFLFCILALFLTLIVAALLSPFILAQKISFLNFESASCIAIFIGAFIPSFLACRKLGKPLITVLLFLLFYFILLYLMGSLMFLRLIPSNLSVPVSLSCSAASLSGAIISAFFKRRHN